jgi:predicted RNase H-like HicB family nuclease
MEPNFMKYKVVLEDSEEGVAVSVPGLPGCHSQGATEQEAIENIKQAIQEYLQVMEEISKKKKIREIEVPVE